MYAYAEKSEFGNTNTACISRAALNIDGEKLILMKSPTRTFGYDAKNVTTQQQQQPRRVAAAASTDLAAASPSSTTTTTASQGQWN